MTKYSELLEILKNLTETSIEAYTAQHKPESEWDEYDYMMIPQWKEALNLIEKATGDE